MLAASFIPMFTAGGNAIGGNAVTAYGRVALIIAILGPVFCSSRSISANSGTAAATSAVRLS